MNESSPQDESLQDAWRERMDGEPSSADACESLSPEQQRALADEQLLHAMLVHHFTDTEASCARRVDRVLHAITPRARRPLWFRVARASLSSAAAVVLVAVIVQVLWPAPTAAMSEFDKVVNAFLAEGDRAYTIQFTMQRGKDAPEESPHSAGRGRRKGPPPEATIYFRGGSQYVFEMKLHDGKSVWIGQNDRNSWAVRPHGPVLLSQDRDAFRLPFFEEMTTILLIDVRDTLQSARGGYELDQPQRVVMEDGRSADYFTARRRGEEWRRPQKLELWADPNSGLIYRMVCSQMRFDGVVCQRLRMDFRSAETLPADWFDYRGHSPADAEIKTVTKEDIERHRRERREQRGERWKQHRMRRENSPPAPAAV